MAKGSKAPISGKQKKRAGAGKRRLKKPLPRGVRLKRMRRSQVVPGMAPLMKVAPKIVAQLMAMRSTVVRRRAARTTPRARIRTAAAQRKTLPRWRILRIALPLRALRTTCR